MTRKEGGGGSNQVVFMCGIAASWHRESHPAHGADAKDPVIEILPEGKLTFSAKSGARAPSL